MRNYSKDFDRYAAQAERHIDELEIATIVNERLQRTGIAPAKDEGIVDVALAVVGFAASMALFLWLPNHDTAND
jgi:hypothetical protein